MVTGYEDRPLDELKAFIEAEQAELMALNNALHAREWELRHAVWELEKRLRKAV